MDYKKKNKHKQTSATNPLVCESVWLRINSTAVRVFDYCGLKCFGIKTKLNTLFLVENANILYSVNIQFFFAFFLYFY